jgi:hypothetical protein
MEPGLEPCGDLVGHMDRFIELVSEVWQVDLTEHHYTFHWYTYDSFETEANCGAGRNGCASGNTARSFAAPLDHELVHLVSFAVGHPPSFYAEGAAVAFELPSSSTIGLPGMSRILDLMAVPSLSGDYYGLAGAYTRHLIDRHGMAAYLKFYGQIDRAADLDAIGDAHAAAFAESLDDSIAAFDAERRDCEHDRFRFKLFECAAPRVEWKGEALTVTRGISCADNNVVGPFLSDADARTYASFDVAEAGLFELSVASDDVRATATLGACGGCESASPVTLAAGLGLRRVFLDAGPHYLRLETTSTEDSVLALQLKRVD